MTPIQLYDKYPNPGPEREAAVVEEVIAGNVPSWCKDKWIEILPGLSVAPDYLAFGTDDDFCRCPLTPYAAQYLATHFNVKLPTARLVDLIYAHAKKLSPHPQNWYLHPASMRTGANYILFNKIIGTHPTSDAPLLGGHKKDVVSDVAGFHARPHHVAIYGWHQAAGHPIQPLTTVHDWMYEDYSHGIRFVKCEDPTLAGPCSLDTAPPIFLRNLK